MTWALFRRPGSWGLDLQNWRPHADELQPAEKVSTTKKSGAKSRGIPHLAKNERDTPNFPVRSSGNERVCGSLQREPQEVQGTHETPREIGGLGAPGVLFGANEKRRSRESTRIRKNVPQRLKPSIAGAIVARVNPCPSRRRPSLTQTLLVPATFTRSRIFRGLAGPKACLTSTLGYNGQGRDPISRATCSPCAPERIASPPGK